MLARAGWRGNGWRNSRRPLYGLFAMLKPEAYKCSVVPGIGYPLHVLGPYVTPCGGCDAIQPQGRQSSAPQVCGAGTRFVRRTADWRQLR